MSPTSSSAAATPPSSDFQEVHLNVLGYLEDGEWVALALEMDIRGYGQTFEEALQELRDLVLAQISFAAYKKQPEMIWRPAESVWFQLFADARRDRMESLLRPVESTASTYHAGGLALSTAEILDNLDGAEYHPVDA